MVIYQDVKRQSLQAEIKHRRDDGKTGGGRLIKVTTSSEYMHHVIPVILYLCLAVKSVIAATCGFLR